MRKILLSGLFLIPGVLLAQTTAQLFEQAKAQGDLHTQIALLTQVIKQSPNHVGAYHYRADAYQALGDMRLAIQDYNHVISLRPKDPFRYYARGLAYTTMEEHALAAADFTKAISLNPSYAGFYLARARSNRALGKYARSLADYEKYAGTWKKASREILNEAIPVSLEAYQYNTAQELLGYLSALGEDSSLWHIWQGRIFYNEGKWDEAISAFSKAINRNDKAVQAYQLRGNAFREIADYEAALEDYTRVLALAPQAYWFNRRGLVYEEMKDFEKAAADYSRAIELDPKWAVAYNNRGFAKMNLKEYAQAKEDFETAIKLDSSAPTPYINLAGVYWLYKKDRKHMYENLQKAVRHNFKNYDSLYNDNQKGWMFKNINQTAEFRSALYK